MRRIAPTQRMANGMVERIATGWDGITNAPRPVVGWDPTASSSFKSALKVKPKRNLSRPQSRQGGSRDRRVSETFAREPVKIVWGTPKKNPLKPRGFKDRRRPATVPESSSTAVMRRAHSFSVCDNPRPHTRAGGERPETRGGSDQLQARAGRAPRCQSTLDDHVSMMGGLRRTKSSISCSGTLGTRKARQAAILKAEECREAEEAAGYEKKMSDAWQRVSLALFEYVLYLSHHIAGSRMSSLSLLSQSAVTLTLC